MDKLTGEQRYLIVWSLTDTVEELRKGIRNPKTKSSLLKVYIDAEKQYLDLIHQLKNHGE